MPELMLPSARLVVESACGVPGNCNCAWAEFKSVHRAIKVER
jgi:hypothetical protein